MMEKGWRITDRNDSTESCNERINILSVVLQNPYIIVWQDYAGEYICPVKYRKKSWIIIRLPISARQNLSGKD